MNIELLGGQNPNLTPSQHKHLSQQMNNILAELKIPVNQIVQVRVGESTAISQAEREGLLNQLKASSVNTPLIQQLKNPTSRLVQLNLQNKSFFVITDVSLQPDQKLLLKSRNAFFVTPTPAPLSAATEGAKPQPSDSTVTAPPVNTTPTLKPGVIVNSVNSRPHSPKSVSSKPTSASPTDLTPPTAKVTANAKPGPAIPAPTPFIGNSPRNPQPPSSSVGEPSQIGAKHFSTGIGAGTESAKPSPRAVNLPALSPDKLAAMQNIKLEAIRFNLPIATPLAKSKLFTAPYFQSNSSPPVATRDSGSITSLLASNATQLANATLKVGSNAPPSVPDIRNAIRHSGIFWEADTAKVQSQRPSPTDQMLPKSEDVKFLLSQMHQTLNQLQNTPIAKKDSETLELLLRLITPPATTQQNKQNIPTSEKGQTAEQLSRLSALTQRVLAQIQLRQLQSSAHVTADTAPLAPTWVTDIPIRFPDGIFNLLLFFFDPESKRNGKEKTDKERPKAKSWRMRLDLDLDDNGLFSADICVTDNAMDATIWASEEKMRNLARSKLVSLKQDLLNRGVIVKQIHCADQPLQAVDQTGWSAGGPLVDVET